MNAGLGKIVQDNPVFSNSFWNTNSFESDEVDIQLPGEALKSSFWKRKRI